MNILKNITSLLFLLLLLLSQISVANQSHTTEIWEKRFHKFLEDVQENSIRNHDWNKDDWKKFRNNQLKLLPIKDKDQFNNAITQSLKELGDNHSYLIIKSESYTENKSSPKASVEVDNGIGIINIPTFMIDEVDNKDEILSANWVKNFHAQLQEKAILVQKGWIIDLTENEGGNFFPMIAALSSFYHKLEIGGFYFYAPNGIEEKQLISFDGKSFFSNGEAYLSYEKKFPVNQNKLPVIVLIGSKTSSSAEFLALALKRQPNTTLIGEATYGIASVNSGIELPDNLGYYMLTIGYYLDSSNNPLHTQKVQPDVIFKGSNKELIQKAKSMILSK